MKALQVHPLLASPWKNPKVCGASFATSKSLKPGDHGAELQEGTAWRTVPQHRAVHETTADRVRFDSLLVPGTAHETGDLLGSAI